MENLPFSAVLGEHLSCEIERAADQDAPVAVVHGNIPNCGENRIRRLRREPGRARSIRDRLGGERILLTRDPDRPEGTGGFGQRGDKPRGGPCVYQSHHRGWPAATPGGGRVPAAPP